MNENKKKNIIKKIIKNNKKNMTDEQKQRYREARKHKYHNMSDEQKQKYLEAEKDSQKEYKKYE